MHRLSLTMLLRPHLVRMHGNHVVLRGGLGGNALGARFKFPGFFNNRLDFCIRFLREKGGLSGQGGFDFAGEFEPFLAGPGFQVAEGADRFLSGSFGSGNGFNEEIIGIGFIALFGGGFSYEHATII